jgi:hypothetical protein
MMEGGSGSYEQGSAGVPYGQCNPIEQPGTTQGEITVPDTGGYGEGLPVRQSGESLQPGDTGYEPRARYTNHLLTGEHVIANTRKLVKGLPDCDFAGVHTALLAGAQALERPDASGVRFSAPGRALSMAMPPQLFLRDSLGENISVTVEAPENVSELRAEIAYTDEIRLPAHDNVPVNGILLPARILARPLKDAHGSLRLTDPEQAQAYIDRTIQHLGSLGVEVSDRLADEMGTMRDTIEHGNPITVKRTLDLNQAVRYAYAYHLGVAYGLHEPTNGTMLQLVLDAHHARTGKDVAVYAYSDQFKVHMAGLVREAQRNGGRLHYRTSGTNQ